MSVLEVWTDGASNVHHPKLPGGWSAVYVYNNMLIRGLWGGEAPTTSQRMELTGALSAMTYLDIPELKDIKYNELKICSDSAYLINCMTEMWYINWQFNNWISDVTHESVKNVDLWKAILNAQKKLKSKGIIITWYKVHGHAGLMYNEVADKLARRGKAGVS